VEASRCSRYTRCKAGSSGGLCEEREVAVVQIEYIGCSKWLYYLVRVNLLNKISRLDLVNVFKQISAMPSCLYEEREVAVIRIDTKLSHVLWVELVATNLCESVWNRNLSVGEIVIAEIWIKGFRKFDYISLNKIHISKLSINANTTHWLITQDIFLLYIK
jgi:hypothetical protein